eukprot:3579108-Amphidinium_carterae.2
MSCCSSFVLKASAAVSLHLTYACNTNVWSPTALEKLRNQSCPSHCWFGDLPSMPSQRHIGKWTAYYTSILYEQHANNTSPLHYDAPVHQSCACLRLDMQVLKRLCTTEQQLQRWKGEVRALSLDDAASGWACSLAAGSQGLDHRGTSEDETGTGVNPCGG